MTFDITKPCYTIDTGSLIKMFRDDSVYSKKHFKSLWENVSKLFSEGVIISHIEVFEEIKNGGIDDDLFIWAKANKGFFLDYDIPKETNVIADIGEKFMSFSHQKKEKSAHADPWLVAQAKSQGLTVITEEAKTGGEKIPKVCQEFGVDCIDLLGLIKKYNWVF